MTPMMFAVLGCAFELILSIFLLRYFVRVNKYGYVGGTILLCIAVPLLSARILGAVAAAYFVREIARQVLLALLGAFAAGALIGTAAGKISNKREPN
jgi:hypothetical protein